MIVAYEIGYWSNNEWVSCDILSAKRVQDNPRLLDDRLKYSQGWEMTLGHAKKHNYVGYINQPHLPGSTIVRQLIVGEE